MVSPVRSLARAALGSVFVLGGVNQLRGSAVLAPMVDKAKASYGIDVPVASQHLVLANGAGMLAAGTALALGRSPRLSALALAGLLTPTNLVGHAFWQCDDPGEKFQHRNEFMSNVAITGGLLLAALGDGRREKPEPTTVHVRA